LHTIALVATNVLKVRAAERSDHDRVVLRLIVLANIDDRARQKALGYGRVVAVIPDGEAAGEARPAWAEAPKRVRQPGCRIAPVACEPQRFEEPCRNADATPRGPFARVPRITFMIALDSVVPPASHVTLADGDETANGLPHLCL
jgi:hypothetical protein